MAKSGSIRSQLKRRAGIAYAIVIAGAAAAFLGVRFTPPDIPREFAFMAGIAAFGIGLLLAHRLVRCPRCRGSLMATMGTPRLFGTPVGYCHFCGIALDERWPPGR